MEQDFPMGQAEQDFQRQRIFGLLLVFIVFCVAVAIFWWPFQATEVKRERFLKTRLADFRSSIKQFEQDTGCYPLKLSSLLLATDNPPALGIDSDGNLVKINPAKVKGPYLTASDGQVPKNPITDGNTEDIDWFYELSPPNVGKVYAPCGKARDGTDYSTW